MIAILVLAACLQGQPPTLDAEAGFQGTVFADAWTRLSATIAYEGESLDAELRVTLHSFASDPVVYRRPLRLVRKVRMRTGFDLYLTSYDYSADVELVAKGQVLRKSTLTFTNSQNPNPRLLVVGPPPAILMEAMAIRPPVTMVRLSPELLPTSALTLRCVDTILIPEAIPLDPGQEAALEEWIRGGGRLVFGSGRSTELRQNPFWRQRCGLEAPEIATVTIPGKDAGQPLTLVRGRQTRGRASGSVAGQPLALRDSEGRGETVFVTVLVDQPGLSKVVSAGALLSELLNLPPPPKEEIIPRTKFVRRAEWQLGDNRAQRLFATPEILRRLIPPDWSLSMTTLLSGSALVLVYIAFLGPVEYLRLRKSGRLRSGWRSLLLLVAVFGAVLYAWSQWAAPRSSRHLVVTILDDDGVRSFTAFRPARGDVYEVRSPGPLTVLPPSRAFGAAETTEPAVVTSSDGGRLPIPPSETRLFVASRPPTPAEAGISARWTDAKHGAVTVQNTADFPLENCFALSKESAWPLPSVAAGATLTASLGNPQSFATWAYGALDGTRVWWPDGEAWTPAPPDRLAASLAFFEAFQEQQAVTRTRRLLQERGVDWSGILAAGGVVVVGSFDRNLSQVEIAGGPAPVVKGLARVRVQEASK